MDTEKAWTLAATYRMVLGAGLIVICAMFWVIALVLLDGFMLAVAAILSPFLIPIGWVVFSRTPRSRPFPILSSMFGPGRARQQPYGAGPYSAYSPPYQPQAYLAPGYPSYAPPSYAPPAYAQPPYAPDPYAPPAYAPQPYAPPAYATQPYAPPAYASQPSPGAPPVAQAPTPPYQPPSYMVSPYAAYGQEVEQVRGVAVEPLAPTVPTSPPEGFVRADWPIDSPPPWPTEGVPWADGGGSTGETVPPGEPVPVPGALPDAPVTATDATASGTTGPVPDTRQDGRPPIAIHDFDWYLAGFLGATLIGAGLLAFGPSGSAIVGLLVFMCFLVSFSFPSLMWIAFVHHRRKAEPEPREGVLLALGGGMLATVPALFANTFASVFSADIAVAVVAPLVEEFSKALVLVFVMQEVNSRYDGLIYGVTAGMGFAMMENLTYSLSAISGVEAGLARATSWGLLSLLRGLASTVGHGVGVGLVGYALAAYIDPRRRSPFGNVVLAYLAAVGLHASWNGSLIVASSLGDTASLVMNATIIVVLPILEIGILLTFMRRGRDAGDEYEGGGVYHRVPPPKPMLPQPYAWTPQAGMPPPWQPGYGPPPWPPPY